MKRTWFLFLLIITLLSNSYSQILDPVKWKFTSDKISNEIYQLKFEAHIDNGWHIYGLDLPEGGPVPTSFTFKDEGKISFLSKIYSLQSPVVIYDSTFNMKVELYSNNVSFIRNVKLINNLQLNIKGFVTYMCCNDFKCLPPKEIEFNFNIPENENQKSISSKRINNVLTDTSTISAKPTAISGKNDKVFNTLSLNRINIQKSKPTKSPKGNNSILSLFIIAFLAGFGAILTPCVYPIIPLTVSFFMRDTIRSKAITNGVYFGISIVFIYTMVGLITGLLRIDLARLVSSHWLPNLIFFLIFIALALSFFGLFEINLPGSISNKIDRQADKGGLFGPFFMALATVFISFSCTGPIVGVVLGSALQGEIVRPVIGMFGFSLSFALPFTLLAIFPGWMKNLPKSGGWLNSVKVFFAFILLLFSLVFLASMGIKIITRDAILAIAIVILFMLGLYLIGKVRFSHDSNLDYISVPRLLLAIASFSMGLYLIPGLFGAPLKLISPFLPPKEEMSFDLTRNNLSVISSADLASIESTCNPNPKYSDFLSMPLGLKGYFDYNEALACAAKLNKPVLLDFAGHGCKNCKKMYSEVWSDPRVMEKLQHDFVIAVLFTDDWTKLDTSDYVTSTVDGKVKNTIGKKFSDLQIALFGSNALPLYAIVDKDGNILTDQKYTEYNPDVESFIEFLENGLNTFSQRKTN